MFLHSLQKVKLGKGSVNFRKSICIYQAEICCKDRRKYANVFGYNQSRFHGQKFAKRSSIKSLYCKSLQELHVSADERCLEHSYEFFLS